MAAATAYDGTSAFSHGNNYTSDQHGDARNISRFEEEDAELEPLARPPAEPAHGRFLTVGGLLMVVLFWCMLDKSSESMRKALFETGVADVTATDVFASTKYFQSPITLTFLQLSFMAVAFALMWYVTASDMTKDIQGLNGIFFSSPWPILVMTHLFGTFWLHALTMPAQVMSLGFFAATRAAEVPLSAMVRSNVLGLRWGGHAPRTVFWAAMANMLLFYSYVQMEGCLCIFEGHGVWLSGAALYGIYLLLLALPAVNAVCQETMMVKFGMNPFLMLALMNLCSAVLFMPMLVLENWTETMTMLRYTEFSLIVLWLCVQSAGLAMMTISLVWWLDSFWAVTLRSMRVVYWWGLQLFAFYSSTGELLSAVHPHISAWSFGMITGVALMACTMWTDRKYVSHACKTEAGTKLLVIRGP